MSYYFIPKNLTDAEYKELAKSYDEKVKSIQDTDAEMLERNNYDLDDCFVSHFSHGIMSKLYRTLAEICRNGGKSTFVALADLEGNLVPSKLISGKYGMCWALTDFQGNFIGQFISAFPKRESTMRKKGYQEIEIEDHACVTLQSNGTGLAGAFQTQVVVKRDFRTDEN